MYLFHYNWKCNTHAKPSFWSDLQNLFLRLDLAGQIFMVLLSYSVKNSTPIFIYFGNENNLTKCYFHCHNLQAIIVHYFEWFFVFGFVLAIVFTSKISLNYFYSAAMCFHAWYNDYLQYFIIFSELFISINLPTTVEDIFPFWSKRTVAAKIMNNYHIKMIFSFIKENKKMKSIFLMANRFGCICV